MINARSVVIAILGTVLSAAPLIHAQDLKPSGSAAIRELALQPQPFLADFTFQEDSIPPSAQTPDLSRYRDFRLGMTVAEVAKQTNMELSEVTVIHERPAVIRQLDWQPLPSIDSSVAADPAEEITFSFYNDELFRMTVNYASERTEGLSEADLIKAISATYGAATRPSRKTTLTSLSLTDVSGDRVIARWETPQYSISLVRSSSDASFGMLLLSKGLNSLARTGCGRGDPDRGARGCGERKGAPEAASRR
ncbi:MAG TPA: hypothetical protein VMP68_31415 [Candidatus Eisenbacteria bacterium]|nr:hypothetical protein [Candidatus Eisenbacteria bacterium]